MTIQNKRSYYTSRCRLWLDHNVLNYQSELSHLQELIQDGEGHNIEQICEWIIDKVEATPLCTSQQVELIESEEYIDYIRIAKALIEEYGFLL